jgi:hypothetical protein
MKFDLDFFLLCWALLLFNKCILKWEHYKEKSKPAVCVLSLRPCDGPTELQQALFALVELTKHAQHDFVLMSFVHHELRTFELKSLIPHQFQWTCYFKLALAFLGWARK